MQMSRTYDSRGHPDLQKACQWLLNNEVHCWIYISIQLLMYFALCLYFTFHAGACWFSRACGSAAAVLVGCRHTTADPVFNNTPGTPMTTMMLNGYSNFTTLWNCFRAQNSITFDKFLCILCDIFGVSVLSWVMLQFSNTVIFSAFGLCCLNSLHDSLVIFMWPSLLPMIFYVPPVLFSRSMLCRYVRWLVTMHKKLWLSWDDSFFIQCMYMRFMFVTLAYGYVIKRSHSLNRFGENCIYSGCLSSHLHYWWHSVNSECQNVWVRAGCCHPRMAFYLLLPVFDCFAVIIARQ